MASNPIQRRARQSFLIGFLLALIIMAIVVVLLFSKISKLKADVVKATVGEKTIYTVLSTIKSGEVIKPEMLTPVTARSEMDVSYYLTDADLYAVDENGNEKEFVAKVEIAAGSVLTSSMIREKDKVLGDDERIIEYNMISLPSQLSNHDYVDIRISFPSGASYIVLPKKYVEATTATSIWMQMSEMDIQHLNSAIVETAQIQGARLYATTYIEPGLQNEAYPTYAVNERVLEAIQQNKNILDEAIQKLSERWASTSANTTLTDFSIQRQNTNNYLAEKNDSEKAGAVENANATEDEAIKSARDAFVASMEGTGLIGTEQY